MSIPTMRNSCGRPTSQLMHYHHTIEDTTKWKWLQCLLIHSQIYCALNFVTSSPYQRVYPTFRACCLQSPVFSSYFENCNKLHDVQVLPWCGAVREPYAQHTYINIIVMLKLECSYSLWMRGSCAHGRNRDALIVFVKASFEIHQTLTHSAQASHLFPPRR